MKEKKPFNFCSEATKYKQQHLETILRTHIRIVKAIFGRNNYSSLSKKYIWIDLNAGTGWLKKENSIEAGSPIIFLQIAEEFPEIDFVCCLFEDYFFDELVKNLQHYRKLKNVELLFFRDHNTINLHTNKKYYGMIYHDPSGFPNFDLIENIYKNNSLNLVDVLINCPTTTVKRVRKAHEDYLKLNEYLLKIKKSNWCVREPFGKQQWSLLIGTNWDNFPTFSKQGFYQHNSEYGASILKKMNETKKELMEANKLCFLDIENI